MTLTQWIQARFWQGIALMVARPGVEAKVEKLIADYAEEALNAEIARLEAEAAAAP